MAQTRGRNSEAEGKRFMGRRFIIGLIFHYRAMISDLKLQFQTRNWGARRLGRYPRKINALAALLKAGTVSAV
ncbi:hypothetical protein [Paraburkholderia caffeinitolerans]|uniref:hypothetical protein n=1 Tax=Paraburkholderia caffeinitolerans TaxID=1723730 RepID=UPI0015837D00|nr:hypothetical protein [Paraburkholderia caffeinitolerans]